jgi:Tfp pilus assembly protein PilZ
MRRPGERTINRERRTSDRASVKFKVSYIHKGDYLISFSKDISVDGMFLSTENPPPVGDYPQLTFSIGEIEEVTVTAKVVWVSNPGAVVGPGMAVQFLEMPAVLKETILKIVNRVSVLEHDGNA